jgi:hypothetical protein
MNEEGYMNLSFVFQMMIIMGVIGLVILAIIVGECSSFQYYDITVHKLLMSGARGHCFAFVVVAQVCRCVKLT